MQKHRLALALCAGVAACAPAGAQEPQPETQPDPIQQELDALRKRIDELERAQQASPLQEPVFAPESPDALSQPSPALGQGNLFNPSLTFYFDMGASISSDSNDNRFNRFNLREIEMDARAPIAPFADGVFTLAFAEEYDYDEDAYEFHTEIEEGYIDFHTLPWDLSVTAGQFRNAFGRNNLLHTHDLPQVDRPLAVQAFLGEEGLSTIGASVDWLVPNPGDKYIELTAQIVNADGGEESPILGGGAGADDPAVLAHLSWFEDVGEHASIDLGGSYLYSHTSDDSAYDANVFGIDATYLRRNPHSPDSRSFLVQSEFFFSDADIDDGGNGTRNSAFGMYAFAQWQLDRNWFAGVRYDFTEFPTFDERFASDRDWAISPYVSFYLTEFLRFRVEYQHLEQREDRSWDSEDILYFQLTFLFGAHPPHPYWVNR